MKKILHIGLWVFFVLFVLFCGAFVYIRNLAPDWPKPITGVSAELDQPYISVDEITPDNAYYHLMRLKEIDSDEYEFEPESNIAETPNSNVPLGKKLFEQTPVDQDVEEKSAEEYLRDFLDNGYKGPVPVLDRMAASYHDNIGLLYKASACNVIQFPDFMEGETNTDFLLEFMKTSEVALYSICKKVESSPDKALEEMQQILQTFKNTMKISYLMFYVIPTEQMKSILINIRHLSKSNMLPIEQQKKLSIYLLHFEKEIPSIVNTMRNERHFCQNTTKALLLQKDPDSIPGYEHFPVGMKWVIPFSPILGSSLEQTEKNLDTIYLRLISIAEKPLEPLSITYLSEIENFEHLMRETAPSLLIADDPLGRLSVSMFRVSSLTRFFHFYNSTIADLRCTAAFLTVNAYKTENGKLPDSLNELVPEYLDAVPLDPHSGNTVPIQYKKEDNGEWSIFTVEGKYPSQSGTTAIGTSISSADY